MYKSLPFCININSYVYGKLQKICVKRLFVIVKGRSFPDGESGKRKKLMILRKIGKVNIGTVEKDPNFLSY